MEKQRLIKLHQDSVNLPIQVKTAGYRNKIVHTMHKVLRDPIVQAQLNIPVDVAMAELSNAIPIPNEFIWEHKYLLNVSAFIDSSVE